MRVLAIGAHPDDLEILCAGTILRYRADGHDVVMAHASDGARGGPAGTDPSQLRTVRIAEARAAAALAGAVHVSLELPDGELCASEPAQRRRVLALVRETAPDVVITHPPDDYHGDHRELSQLVFAASFAAANPMIESGSADSVAVPALIYLEALAGLGEQPSEFVDISAQIELKHRMLACHASQVSYLRDAFGADISGQVEVTARFRGLQAGVRHAEGFRICRTWHRVRSERLLP